MYENPATACCSPVGEFGAVKTVVVMSDAMGIDVRATDDSSRSEVFESTELVRECGATNVSAVGLEMVSGRGISLAISMECSVKCCLLYLHKVGVCMLRLKSEGRGSTMTDFNSQRCVTRLTLLYAIDCNVQSSRSLCRCEGSW